MRLISRASRCSWLKTTTTRASCSLRCLSDKALRLLPSLRPPKRCKCWLEPGARQKPNPGVPSRAARLEWDDHIRLRVIWSGTNLTPGTRHPAPDTLHPTPDTNHAGRPLDVIVSDIGMPEEDGYELMRKVRALPPDQGGLVPAIALTGYAARKDSELALAAGYQLHLAKPVEPEDLVAAIASLVVRRQ